MSHGNFSVSKEDAKQIIEAGSVSISPTLKKVFLALIGIGLITFVVGAVGEDPKPAWIAFQVNFVFWFVVAAASAGFTAVFQICNAQWVRPIRRIFECTLPYVLYSLLPLLVMYLVGRHHIFSWSHEVVGGKELWLNPHFVYIRDALALIVVYLICRKSVRHSVKRDFIVSESGVAVGTSSDFKSEVGALAVNSTPQNMEVQLEKETNAFGFFSPVVVILFAVFMTLIAFDQIMSVDPHWYSTLFGVFYFMSGVYCAMAWVGIATFILRKRSPLLCDKVVKSTLHDLGKLLFGFGMFWAYMFWSHYLPLWYSNMPEFTGFLIPRLRLEPWHSFAWFVLALCFIIPFFIGLNRDFKQIPAGLAATSVIVLVGVNSFMYLLLTPTIYPDSIPLNISSVLISIGFGAAFMLSAFTQLEKMPQIPFGDFFDKSIKNHHY